MLPVDPFARVHGLSREGVIAQLLADVEELVRDERPGFRRIGQALRKRLAGEAKTIDEALGIANPKHSHNTTQAIVKKLKRRA